MVALGVPNSAGTAAPRLRVPPGACDCHMHTYEPARERAAGTTGTIDPGADAAQRATAADYLLLQQRLGTERTVVVTPRLYGTDNRGTLEAIRFLSSDRTRGVGVVAPDISERDLRSLRDGGVRGVRYSTARRGDIPTGSLLFERIAALAPRLHELGMHLQLHWSPEQVMAHASLFQSLPCTVVIDHVGRLPQGAGMNHPAYAVLRRRLDDGVTWVKLSGWYLDSSGSPFADVAAVAASFVQAAPERMVWGSDWPHATESTKPDDADMLDLLLSCAPGESVRHRILVDNPATLYGF